MVWWPTRPYVLATSDNNVLEDYKCTEVYPTWLIQNLFLIDKVIIERQLSKEPYICLESDKHKLKSRLFVMRYLPQFAHQNTYLLWIGMYTSD